MKKYFALLALLVTVPTMAFAQYGPSVVPKTLERGPYDLVCTIQTVTNWMFTIFLVVAVFFILLAAYYYLLAQGNAEEVQKNHKILLWAAVAIGVAVLSRGFVSVVQKVVGVDAQEACASAGPSSSQSGSTATNSNTSTGSTTNAPTTAPLGFTRADDNTRPFDAIVQKCADGLTPGVVITYDINGDEDGRWSNFDTGVGNPNIPGKATSTSSEPVSNAGNFGIVGNIRTGLFGVAGNNYIFRAETCNDGSIPIVLVDKSQKGAYERVTD